MDSQIMPTCKSSRPRLGLKTVLECARRATWGMLYAGDGGLLRAFGLTISESKTVV